MTHRSGRRTVRAGLAVAATAVLMVALSAAPTAAAPIDFPRGVTLQGACTGERPVVATPLGRGMWSPYLLSYADGRQPTTQVLVPYELRFNGDGAALKSRHGFIPGEELAVTRTPPPGADVVKCQLSADFLVDGAPAHVDADVNGVLFRR